MKNIYRYFLLLLGISTLISCKKSSWYDEKVDKSQSVLSSLSDLKLLISNNDILNTETPAIQEWASDGHVCDPSIFPFLGSNILNAYTWSKKVPYSKVLDWAGINSGGYVRIFNANLVLESLNKISPQSEEEKGEWNNVKGQALFIRAKGFFDLAQVFAPPFSSSNLDLLSIPLRMESDINIPSKRSTVADTYKQITEDLISSRELLYDRLPTTPVFKSNPSKIAADALLARVFLSMEEYDNALKYADLCLGKYNTLIDFNTIDSTSSLPFPVFNAEVIYHTIMSLTMNAQFIFIEKELVNSYANDDLRKVVFFDRSLGDDYIRFKGTYDGYNGSLFSGLGTDELYLIRAECNARLNNLPKALEDLNTLLRVRWRNTVTYIPIETASSDEALKLILAEREKELLCRGIRWSDLRRLNRDPRFAKTLTRQLNGEIYTLEPNSYRYTFPIPDDVVRASGMEQNPGWGN